MSLTRRQRMATVASISPRHMSAQVSTTAKSWWRSSLRLPASQPVTRTVDELNQWQPQVLISYASIAGILADEQLAGRLHIKPQTAYVATEVLTTQIKQRIQEAAKVLVTTLFSPAQPLIRYELNDSIRASTDFHACNLPFGVLDSIQSRVADSLILPAISGGEVVVRPLAINRIMDIVAVTGWQLTQQADNSLVMLLTGARYGLTDEALVNQSKVSLAQEGAQVPYVQVHHVSEIPKTSSGTSPLIRALHPVP